MSNWLTTLGPFLAGGFKLGASAIPGGAIASTAVSLGAPLAASIFKAIVAAQQHHEAKIEQAQGAPVIDTRLQRATSAVMTAMPLIEALAAVTGHPIPNIPEFEASLPDTISNTVAAVKSMAKTLDSLGVKI